MEFWIWAKSQGPEYEGSYISDHIQHMANYNDTQTVLGTYYVSGTILRI